MEDRIRKLNEAYLDTYGTVPPPYVVFDDHPLSLRWRMGPGEDFMRMWWDWWSEVSYPEEEMLEYFQKWPPPHRWLGFVIFAVWDVDTAADPQRAAKCFDRTASLGFGSKKDYEFDFNRAQ